MIVTREDAACGDMESAFFTDDEAGWVHVAWCILDFVWMCRENEDEERITFPVADVVALIQAEKYEEALQFCWDRCGGSVGEDYYIHINNDAPHIQLPEAKEHLRVILETVERGRPT